MKILYLILLISMPCIQKRAINIPSRDCKMSIRKDVIATINSKQPGVISESILLEEKGVLEICIDQQGICNWSFEGKNYKQLHFNIPGFVELLQIVHNDSPQIVASYAQSSTQKGGKLHQVDEHTISIIHTDSITNNRVSTFVDTDKWMILGSTTSLNENEYTTKLVCKYKKDQAGKNILQHIFLSTWDNDRLLEYAFEYM